MSSVPQRVLSEEEFLAFENQSEARHEFYRGEVFAMTGASIRHNRIASNIVVALGKRLAGTPCVPYISTQRIKVAASGLYTYPDASVVCGEPAVDPVDQFSITNPTSLVEVLSPTTEHYDRGDKFNFYKRLAALRCYLLVSQVAARVEVHSCDQDGNWTCTEFTDMKKSLRLPKIGIELPLEEIYAGVTFDPPQNRDGGEFLPIHPRSS